MNYKVLHKIFAAVTFLISLLVLFSTVQPSVSFWDCGEFIASGYYLQVPHPPGAPFFLLLGKIFSMVPFVANIGLRFNSISVLTSALSILFLYLIAVKLIENYRGKTPQSTLDAVGTYLAAAIGALSFSFSDTFWFNGVEAEVYAFSIFLVAFVTWLIIVWNDKAENPDNEKYILMIAYLIGIATGVHLMAVLAIVPVVMVILFRKYVVDEEALKKTGYIFIAHAALLVVISLAMWASTTSTTPPSPEDYQAYDTKFKLIALGISALIMGVFYKKIFTRNSFYMPLIIGGIALFITYPGVVKFLPEVIAGITGDNSFLAVVVLAVILGALWYGVVYARRENKPTLHLSLMTFMFVLIGFTTFAMVIIRANMKPPMNENDPDNFTELVSYLNRDQYGDFPTFKRRFATEPHQMVVYNNYSSDLDFFWRYQMNHMMTRYWLWNYAGREGWQQDDGPDIAPFNQIGNFFGGILGGIHFDGSAKDSLYAVPFLLGLLGIYFHFKKDWKMAAAFMVMFILMGYLTAFYQNQQQPQPRERDYFYVGAFFVFSIWIAIGVRGLIDLAMEKISAESMRTASVVGILAFGVILVPYNMYKTNYFTHDRSQNWVPWDYSYNLLQSCAPNAVLFTNGDNDTFPLWYLQDVEGVRRDVKIANLSLLNTNWYIEQLKGNDPYGVGTVNIRMSNEQIDQLRPVQWETQKVSIPVPKAAGRETMKDVYQTYDISDSSVMKQGAVEFTMKNTLTFGQVKAVRVQDLMVREIIEANNWQRPIYFAVTCSDDSKIGLQDYLKMEGMALRLVPEKRKQGVEFVNADVLEKELQENPGYSKTYKPGFKFRGLNNPNIFFDDNHVRMTQNYRNAFMRLAIYDINTNQDQKAIAALDEMEKKIPRENIPMDYEILFEVGNMYWNAGAMKQYKEIAAEVETEALKRLEQNPNDVQSYYNPYRILIETYENLKDYSKLLGLWQRLGTMYPNDPNVKANIAKYANMAKKDRVEVDSVPRPDTGK